MFITGLGTAAPSQCYSQKQCWEIFSQSRLSQRLKPRSRAIVKKVLTGNNGIATRRLALDDLREAFDLSPDALHSRFRTHAPRLATQAAERALSDAAIDARQIDAVLISTCTGYLCPGLTSYVSEGLGLRPDVFALDLRTYRGPNSRNNQPSPSAGTAEPSRPLRRRRRRDVLPVEPIAEGRGCCGPRWRELSQWRNHVCHRQC